MFCVIFRTSTPEGTIWRYNILYAYTTLLQNYIIITWFIFCDRKISWTFLNTTCLVLSINSRFIKFHFYTLMRLNQHVSCLHPNLMKTTRLTVCISGWYEASHILHTSLLNIFWVNRGYDAQPETLLRSRNTGAYILTLLYNYIIYCSCSVLTAKKKPCSPSSM